MIAIESLPHVNAALNATAGVLLTVGFLLIRRGRVAAHKACMVAAFAASTLFLACYLVYHFSVLHVPYKGQGAIRLVYFLILVTHIVLAILVVPLSLVTLYRAFRDQFDRHSRVARWTLPIWLYVSVTGVVVYWMLYG